MQWQKKLLLKRIGTLVKLFTIELLIVLLAFTASFITVVFFIRLIFVEKKMEFDMQVFEFIKPAISSNMTAVMNFFTFFGSHYFLLPANFVLVLYTFFITKDKWFAIKILSVTLSSLLLMFTLKSYFQRPRPLIPLLEAARGLSFPSGHAFISFAFFGLLIYMVYKKVTTAWLKYSLIVFFFFMTTIVGFSRIYLRVHYASDVFAGFSLSLVWLVISLSIIGRIEKSRTKLALQIPKTNSDLKSKI